MPAATKLTKEAIAEGAFDLVRAEGHEALTARNLAARLGCSTQPLLYWYASVDDIRKAAYARADAWHTAYLTAPPEDGRDPLSALGLRYIRFAAEEPRLFRFLFQSDHFAGRGLDELVADPQAGSLSALIRSETGLDAARSAALFKALFIAAHGYASLLANNAMRWDPADAEALLDGIGAALLTEVKEEKP